MAKILVVDDDPDECGLVVLALGFAGHHVYAAASMEAANRLLKEAHPDLIVRDESHPSIPQSELWQGRKLPVITITKPVSADDLTHKVTLSLKKSSSRG